MRILPKEPVVALLLGVIFWFSLIAIDSLLVYGGLIEYARLIEVFTNVVLIFSCCAIYFRQVREHEHFVVESVFLGLTWLATTILLDIFVTAPAFGFETTEYLLNVGWEYVTIPIQTLIFGIFVHYTALQDYF